MAATATGESSPGGGDGRSPRKADIRGIAAGKAVNVTAASAGGETMARRVRRASTWPDRPSRDRERGQGRPVRFERREKAPDPNSPFAKLAALKAQLEADAKERR